MHDRVSMFLPLLVVDANQNDENENAQTPENKSQREWEVRF